MNEWILVGAYIWFIKKYTDYYLLSIIISLNKYKASTADSCTVRICKDI